MAWEKRKTGGEITISVGVALVGLAGILLMVFYFVLQETNNKSIEECEHELSAWKKFSYSKTLEEIKELKELHTRRTARLKRVLESLERECTRERSIDCAKECGRNCDLHPPLPPQPLKIVDENGVEVKQSDEDLLQAIEDLFDRGVGELQQHNDEILQTLEDMQQLLDKMFEPPQKQTSRLEQLQELYACQILSCIPNLHLL